MLLFLKNNNKNNFKNENIRILSWKTKKYQKIRISEYLLWRVGGLTHVKCILTWRGELCFDGEVACTVQLYFCCVLQETESHPVPWASSSSSSSSSNMKTWTVCTDPVSIPHRHNRDLHHLNYQIHLIELISATPTVSLKHFTACVSATYWAHGGEPRDVN